MESTDHEGLHFNVNRVIYSNNYLKSLPLPISVVNHKGPRFDQSEKFSLFQTFTLWCISLDQSGIKG